MKKILVFLLVIGSCYSIEAATMSQGNPQVEVAPNSQFSLTSPAFKQGEAIPIVYTCDGKDISPPLAWSGFPVQAKSFVLIVDDPDAAKAHWAHWILYNIPAKTNGLEEGVSHFPEGTQQGDNDWKTTQYKGPCPPQGEHRYVFKLYALDNMLPVGTHVTSEKLLTDLKGHELGVAELSGKYQRPK